MNRIALWIVLSGAALAGCAKPIALRTYDKQVMVFPDFLPLDQPTVFAFLDGNDRRCDSLIRPLRSLSHRVEAQLVGVLTYEDNSFLEQISSKREIVFPMLLDPRKKLVSHFGISRFPTYVYVSPAGKEVTRAYDIKEVTPWYTSKWVAKAVGRNRPPTPEDMLDE